MRRVVITGLGIVSPIGNSVAEVEASLRAGKSGIVFAPEYAEHGFRSQVHGMPQIDLEAHIDKRNLRFMGPGAAYNFLAMQQAIADSGLEESDVSNERSGLIMGSGGPSTSNFFTAFDCVINKGAPKKMGPFMVTRCMSSTNSACLATPFRIKGVNYSITSACSTSAHCIGNGVEQIQMGKQDIVFAGGGEELDWTLSCLFDAMGAMSSKYNDTPETASRTYDATRDGFVIAGGGGVVVLEELSHALARGAKIYAEIVGYGANSDGAHITQLQQATMQRCMEMALKDANITPDQVGYVNGHGTATEKGDIAETQATAALFGQIPLSSQKSYFGHTLGACGALESWFSIEMMNSGWFAPTLNLDNIDPLCGDLDYIRGEGREIHTDYVVNNNFAFGGVNTSLVFKRWQE